MLRPSAIISSICLLFRRGECLGPWLHANDSGNTEKQVIATRKQINKVKRVIGSNDGEEMRW